MRGTQGHTGGLGALWRTVRVASVGSEIVSPESWRLGVILRCTVAPHASPKSFRH